MFSIYRYIEGFTKLRNYEGRDDILSFSFIDGTLIINITASDNIKTNSLHTYRVTLNYGDFHRKMIADELQKRFTEIILDYERFTLSVFRDGRDEQGGLQVTFKSIIDNYEHDLFFENNQYIFFVEKENVDVKSFVHKFWDALSYSQIS